MLDEDLNLDRLLEKDDVHEGARVRCGHQDALKAVEYVGARNKAGEQMPDNRQGGSSAMALDMAGNALNIMWKITVVDIRTTLDEVANCIFEGRDIPRLDPVNSIVNILKFDDDLDLPLEGAVRRR